MLILIRVLWSGLIAMAMLLIGVESPAKIVDRGGIAFLQPDWNVINTDTVRSGQLVSTEVFVKVATLFPAHSVLIDDDLYEGKRRILTKGAYLILIDGSRAIYCQQRRGYKQSNNRWVCLRDKDLDGSFDVAFDASAQGEIFVSGAAKFKERDVVGGKYQRAVHHLGIEADLILRRASTPGYYGKTVTNDLEVCALVRGGKPWPCLESRIPAEHWQSGARFDVFGSSILVRRRSDKSLEVDVTERSAQATTSFPLPGSHK